MGDQGNWADTVSNDVVIDVKLQSPTVMKNVNSKIYT